MYASCVIWRCRLVFGFLSLNELPDDLRCAAGSGPSGFHFNLAPRHIETFLAAAGSCMEVIFCDFSRLLFCFSGLNCLQVIRNLSNRSSTSERSDAIVSSLRSSGPFDSSSVDNGLQLLNMTGEHTFPSFAVFL